MAADSPLPGREGLGVGAAETLGGGVQNQPNAAVGVRQDVRVPETKNAPALAFQISIPLRIARTFCVLPAVDLYNELRLSAREVGDVWAHWQLARELGTVARSGAKAAVRFR